MGSVCVCVGGWGGRGWGGNYQTWSLQVLKKQRKSFRTLHMLRLWNIGEVAFVAKDPEGLIKVLDPHFLAEHFYATKTHKGM